MSNVRITWKDPVLREDGSVLTPSDIARIDIGMKVGGAPSFSPLSSVLPGVESFTQTDLPPGDYEFAAVVVDKQTPAKSSVVSTVSVTIVEPLAAPAPVDSLTAVVF